MKRLLRDGLAGLFALGLAAIAPAAAQPAKPAPAAKPAAEAPGSAKVANNTAFGSWVFNCDAVAVNQTECRLVQLLTRRDNQQLVVRFLVLPAAGGDYLLLAQVPVGAYLPKGAVYRFAEDEKEPQREMIWQRCLGEICEAAIALDKKEKAAFLAHEALLFAYQTEITGEPTIVRVSLERFGDALKALDSAR